MSETGIIKVEFSYGTSRAYFLKNRAIIVQFLQHVISDARDFGLWLELEGLLSGASQLIRLSVKALAGPCRTEPTIAPEVGIRRITVFGTGFYH